MSEGSLQKLKLEEEQLMEHNVQLNQENADLKQENADLKQENANLNQENADLKQECMNMQTKCSQMDPTSPLFLVYQQQITADKQQIAANKQQIAAKEQQITTNMQQIAANKTRIHESSLEASPEYTVMWQKPDMFCKGTGSCWAYQEDKTMMLELKEHLLKHFQASGFVTPGNSAPQFGDKTRHPLFLVCGGAGTGKSRLLDEFPRLCCKEMASVDQHLSDYLKKSYVFKIDLGNGTAAGRFQDPMHYITSRMYYQIIHPRLDWDTLSTSSFHHITFHEIVSKLAESESLSCKEMSIIILVDGLHKLQHTSGSKESILYGVFSRLADWTNTSCRGNNPFVIVSASATLQEPIDSFFADTRQLRLFLCPPTIDGEPIVNPKNDVERMMLLDMGGHPYAIEVLLDKLAVCKSAGMDIDASVVMSDVCSTLKGMYSGWKNPGMYEPALRAILLGSRFMSVDAKLKGISIDRYQQLGLVRWDSTTNLLTCPFVWLRIVTEGNRQLHEIVGASSALKSIQRFDTPSTMPFDITWQHWEDFVARFWCLKTLVFDGCTVRWRDLHNGAFFKTTSDFHVVVKNLQLVTAINHCNTNSTLGGEIATDTGTIQPRNGNHHVISAPGNPGGDSFCFLSTSTGQPVAFSISCKNQVGSRGVKDYKTEHLKAMQGQDDFFMEYSTGPYQPFTADDLPNDKCGLVCDENFISYFGPFAGRAFFLKNLTPPNINTASHGLLQSVDGVGPVLVQNILDQRKRSSIRSVEDAVGRIPGLGQKRAKLFRYQ